MRHIFTTSEQETFTENPSQQSKTNYQLMVLIKKIGSMISTFLKQKSILSDSNSPQENSSEEMLSFSSQKDTLYDFQAQENSKLIDTETNSGSLVDQSVSVKKYYLGGNFDSESKQWKPSFSSSLVNYNEYNREDEKSEKPSIFKGIATTILLVLFSALGVFAQTIIDLSLRSEIDNAAPSLGNTVKFKLWLKNEGTITASMIVVKNKFPITGGLLTSHDGGANFSYTIVTGEGLWSVASLAAGDSASLEIVTKVVQMGVAFNTAEVKSVGENQTDTDSTPDNNKPAEDDITTSCFSVPLYWYLGEEFIVSVPSAFKGTTIKWFRDGVEIIGSTSSAVVNADTTLTIKATGSYSFTTNVGSCAGQGCCAVQVIQGPYGSIGDFVWNDKSGDGIQDEGENGMGGIVLDLFTVDAMGSLSASAIQQVTTGDDGKYLFDSLFTGDYLVRVSFESLSDIYKVSSQKDKGGNDAKDSDFSTSTGFSQKISIYVDSTGNKKNNLTIAGALYAPVGSIGDFVWNDTNKNGLQDGGEAGVKNVIMELYASDESGNTTGVVLENDTTDLNGLYKFNNLGKGSYVVKSLISSFPAGMVIGTVKDSGGDDTKDNDFSSIGLSQKIVLDPVNSDSEPLKKDNLTIDVGIYLVDTIVAIADCPTLTVGAIDGDICVGDTTYLKGTTTNGAKIKWYLTSIDGTAIATINSGDSLMIFPTTTTSYYAEIDSVDASCTNARQAIAVVVNALPSLPTCAGAVDACTGNTINLNDYIINGATTPGGVFEWHTGVKSSLPLVSNPTTVGAGTYYLFEKSGAGCYSPPRLLKVNLKNCDTLIDLSLTKIVNNITPGIGDEVVYSIKIKNEGPSVATNVEIKDILPIGLEFLSSSFFANNGDTLTSIITNIGANQTITLDYLVTVVGANQQTNFAQIIKADQKDVDSTPDNGTTTEEDDDDKITITPKQPQLVADLSLKKTVSNSTPSVGSQITYYIEITNDGNSDATNVEATDIVPSGLEVLTATGGDAMNISGNNVVAKFNKIKVGEVASFQIVVKVIAAGGTIKNLVEITKSDQNDGDSTPNDGTDKGEDDDDYADITVKKTVCNPITPLIASWNPYICSGDSTEIEAIGCNGTIVWSDGQTGNSIYVSPTITTIYTAQCKIDDSCISSKSNPIIIAIDVISAPLVSSSSGTSVICTNSSVTLTASNCTGTITWSNGTIGSSITVSPATTTIYTAVCKKNECVSAKSNNLTVTVGGTLAIPTITSNKSQICNGEAVTLTGSGCSGTLAWSNGMSGQNITFSPEATGTYSAKCYEGDCISSESTTVAVTVLPSEKPVITSTKDNVCTGDSVVLSATNCSGVFSWSTGATSSSIIAKPTETTIYTAKCAANGCEGSTSKTITFGGQTLNAPVITSDKQNICGNETAILTATGCQGVVKWSTGAVGLSISVSTGTYSAACTTTCSESPQSNLLTISNNSILAPTISSPNNTFGCEAGEVTLTATGCEGIVIWSNAETGSTIKVTVATATVYAAACRISGCDSGKSNEITVTVGKPSVPTISSDKTTVCAGDSVILAAAGCATGTLVWSNGLTGTSVTVKPVSTTAYTAVCKLPDGGCISEQSSKVTITVITQVDAPVISCTKSTICAGDTLILNALGCPGTVLWSSGQTNTSIAVHPTETQIYTVLCKIGSCQSPPSAAATVNVGNPLPPVVSCKNTQICSGASTQLEAAGCTGTVKWSDGQIGAVITVSPIQLTSYSAICDAGRCQSEKSNTIAVQVTGTGLIKPTTKDLINTCPFTTVDLTTGVTSQVSSQGGVYVFRTGTTPGSPAVGTPSAVGTGSYYVFEQAGNGCYSEAGKINVQINTCTPTDPPCATNPATVQAGKDTTICISADFLTLKGQIGGAAQSGKWTTTDGKGTFENSLSLNTKYFYSNEDLIKGVINFTLTTNDPDDNGPCLAAVDTFKAILNGVITVPTIETSKSTNICFGDSVVLTANEAAVSYKWSNGDTTRSITVKTTGRYSVKLLNDAGCASLSSNEVIVTLSDPIAAPTVLEMTKNVCPATTANLLSAVSGMPKSSGGVFEFHTGATSTSPMIANASAVGAGTYYVLEKSDIGCYSPTSPIMVMIDECSPTDTAGVELSIVIVGTRVEMKVGDPISYTITVRNNTTHTATNVNIVNVLPKGLEISSTTPGFTAFGKDSLLSIIGSLPGGATKTYTYDAITTKAGKITNIAKITKLDQVDPITSNNISQWTVECKTCQETCVGLSLAADTTRQSNGSYNVTFRAFIESCGNVKLEGVKITENLSTMFTNPVTYTIVQKPTAGVGSKLITNDNFNGSSDINLTIPAGSEIESGVIDTVKFVVNIIPNGSQGPFSTNALVEAIGNTIFGIPQDVSDVSNSGKIVDKPSADPTIVRLFKTPSVGLAKMVLDTTKYANGSYDITYQLLVKNNGALTLNDIIVTDTLSKVFKAPATFTIVAAPTKNSGSQLVINNAFNGSTDTRLTLSGSNLLVGHTDTLNFTMNLQPDTLKAFANTAIVNASGTLTSGSVETVTDLSNAGLNPDAPGINPTNLNLGVEGGSSIEVPRIGIALYVKDTVKQIDGGYNITFNAIIKNSGNLNLTNVELCDTLSKTFGTSIIATVAQKPKISAGSQLKANDMYDGIGNTCLLLSDSQIVPNKVDTVEWVVNVKLDGNKGPFRNSVIVTAKTPGNLVISDVSNDGIDPSPDGSAPTVINFNSLQEAMIGISKEASVPVKVSGNTYDITFKLKVKNYGKHDLTAVQVQDNLAVTFGDSVKIDSVSVKADAGFKVNDSFTGRGSLINLLVDSLSTLPKNMTRTITLFTRVTLAGDKTSFENQALAIGKYPTNKIVDDLSTTGSDPDPDANGIPKDNSIATAINLGNVITPVINTTLGIAKAAVLDSIPNSDDTYNVTYKVIIKNYSTHKLTKVQLSDSLEVVFADSTEFIIEGKPSLSNGSKLKIDTTFNGRSTSTMLVADSSSLAIGASDTLTFKLRILTSKQSDAIFSNSIHGTAKDSTANVVEISQSGSDPDPDGDSNPGNNNAPTILTIKAKNLVPDSLVIIPQGFSPNGDGNGDRFVIAGINKTNRAAEIYIYNRWGQLVYKSLEFGKEEGWDGIANDGIFIGGKSLGVPDGTYYYSIKAEGLWEGKQQIGFITVAR